MEAAAAADRSAERVSLGSRADGGEGGDRIRLSQLSLLLESLFTERKVRKVSDMNKTEAPSPLV